MLELVNRAASLKTKNLYYRTAVVLVPALFARYTVPYIYWMTGKKNQMLSLLDNAPLWKNKFEVPELDKMFFFLDDDNNFSPSLYHYAM